MENKEKNSDNQKTGDAEKPINIEPGEPKTAGANDPGRTTGKAEGEDEESAEK